MTTKRSYKKKDLDKYVEENGIELIGEYEKVNSKTKIKGKCKADGCDGEFEKSFRVLLESGGGPYCKKCVEINKKNRTEATNMERYGSKTSLENKVVQDKIKNTNKNKYNCDNPVQKENKQKILEYNELTIKGNNKKSCFSEKLNKCKISEIYNLSQNYIFICDNCPHNFETNFRNVLSGRWCKYCCKPSKDFCDDLDCEYCLNRSFASFENKTKYGNKIIDLWDKSKNTIDPRRVFKNTHNPYWFICDNPVCKHPYYARIDNIVNNGSDSPCKYCTDNLRNRELCDNDECMLCFNRSFASFKGLTILNKNKIDCLVEDINPRQIPISSQEKYNFNCDNCPHIFESKLGNITSLNRWCPYCCINNSKLCNDLECQYCLNKSFASFTGLTISNTKILDLWSSKNKIKPRDILKTSNKMCMFNCDKCGITFKSKLTYIANNGAWCSNKICKNERIHNTKLKNFACKSCGLFCVFNNQRTRNDKEEGLCDYCQPLKTNKLYEKTKEMVVVRRLREDLPDIPFIHNKSVGNECTLQDREDTNGHLYPDIRFELLGFDLIVEVDEHKHRGAGYSCDERRMYEIIKQLGLPCVFIRYNPDDKKSDYNVLLEMVKEYLEIDMNEIDFDEHSGLKVEYLFY